MNTANLAQYDTEIEAYAAISRPAVSSVLILHQGTIISEHYWRGFSATSYQPIFSVTKSVVSALVGLALADGKLTLSDTLAQWFPEMNLAPESHAASVTIRHLLTMSSGFQRPDGRISPDKRVAVLLTRGADALPGDKFHYINEDVDLLAVLLERALGESVMDYAHRRLFAPLGIWCDVPKSSRKRLWKVDKQGHAKGSHGLHLTTHELALLGQLYLQAGRWHDEQLLPVDFVRVSTTAQIAGSYPEFLNYGYLWWISQDKDGNPAFFASGAGGQFVHVLPAYELVMVITTSLKNLSGRHHRTMISHIVTKTLLS